MSENEAKKESRICAVLMSGMFPSADPVAIDILRLMSGCNDINFLSKWLRETTPDLNALIPRTIATGKISRLATRPARGATKTQGNATAGEG